MSLAFTSWGFDAASYTPGQAINLTVQYTSTDVTAPSEVVSAVTVTLSDAAGIQTQTSDTSGNFPSLEVSAPGNTPQPVTVSATDSQSPAGTWTLVSNTTSSTSAPFAYTAVLQGTAA